MSRLRPAIPWFRLAPFWPTSLVTGAASSTDNAIARFDGTGGVTLQNSGVTIDDSNNITVPLTSSVTVGTIELGHATDTTLARVSAGVVSIEGINIVDLSSSQALTNKTYNGNTFTAGTGVLTIAASKTLTASNTLTLAGTDGTTMTFPGTSATIARIDAANVFTGVQTMTSPSITTSLVTGSTTFALVNATATTINFAGAATALNIGASATCILNFGGSTTASEFRFLEPSGSGTNYSAFKAVAQSADITYSLPPTVGAANTFLTDAAGNGVLTWAAAGGSTDPDLIRLIGNDSTIEGLPIAVAQDLKDAYVGYGSTNVARAIGFGGVGGVFLLNAQTSALGAVDTLCMVVVGSNVFYSRVSGAGSLFRNNRALSAQATMSFSGGTPTAIARMGSDGTSLYIQDGATSTTIKKYSISGDTATFVSNITLDATPDALGGHAQPFGVDSSGNMYICMKSSAVAENQIVRKFDSSGVTQNTVTWTLNSASQSLIGTAVSDGGTIYVVVDHNSATGERDVHIAKIAFS